ncbi:phenylalanine--tRNA ligase subunit beta [Ruminococcaceae bacterium CPB6]|jgi:phenylalanyl-tRNA synthetase beta chain|uniref:Phenylalanine--tRNA ligase beta subunit n=1 Tax=Caproicibacterium lactatifermentans TaxID=2666138 RepID=A0A859DN31_9FIRM|nr:phenylalanine--tRNA ligase subunit beta [Caproicibacterium lactatifermentans]ARP50865.1 phenylalanine--tRNA ligase subunit beta [Ruminococcaceae bacterium CPB6]QKN23407.1 phenylalanine--tRNA ligase subunit beta [Caproicibacterium lactatifermentans]
MNLSMRWLKEFVDLPPMPLRQFTESITLSGSKVESWSTEGEEISKVVVGKVLSLERHPDSDHLWITKTTVNENEEPLQIVTGAQNLKVGDYVPVALHGSTLPGGKKIKRGKLRGVASNGMLCGIAELGLTTHDFPSTIEDGIMVLTETDGCKLQLGMDIHEALGLNDTTVAFEITSNRPDCFSVIGLAREAAATFHLPLKLHTPVVKGGAGDCTGLLDVKIEAPDLCSIYTNRVVKNVRVKPSPLWMRERLRAMGVRPINNIVDITNYVMLEYGQPMHAFDLESVQDRTIRIRHAKPGETITTLDGDKHTLTEKQLVITDSSKPMAIAGVMGGENSGITDNTTTIVFESACFSGPSIRTTARDQSLRTEASGRYEKGLDPNNCIPAINRACELVEMLDAGDVMDGIIVDDHSSKEKHRIRFEPDWTNRFLHTDIAPEMMKKILLKLECEFDGDDILVPTFRPDLEHKADIAEEVARFYGYNSIQSKKLPGGAEGVLTPKQHFLRTVHNEMQALGADEIMSYSFISPKEYDKILMPANDPLRTSVTLRNPLGEDTSIMRTVLLPSVLQILSRNYNNRNPQACLYELANVYLPADGPDALPEERPTLICGMYGEGYDFFTAKGMVETLLAKLCVDDWDITACKDACSYHPGRCAKLSAGEDTLGILGEVHPTAAENYSLDTRVYTFTLDVPVLRKHAHTQHTYRTLPKFPAVTRDLALICDAEVPVGDLEKAIRRGAGKLLETISVFDVYRGEQISRGKKSVAFSLVLRSPDTTLTDEQINSSLHRVMKELEKIGAALRE